MKKVSLLVVLGIVAVCVLFFISSYNGLVSKEESVSKAWSQVENVYQRRYDLIPNLVNTVKGAADYEKSTLEAVVNARAKVGSVQIDANNLTEENVAAFQTAQDQLSSALSRAITLTVERYPELTATQGFRDLQTQLEGTENRISVERNNFNVVVQEYNTAVRRFPANIVASISGFKTKGYFKSVENADKPVSVEFDF